MFKKFAFIFMSALLLATLPVAADEWNKKTTLTFSQPVELPGIVLPAGTYVFKLVDTSTYRHVVQVTNTREDKVFATLLAIPDYRLKATDDTVIHFAERPKDRAEAIRGWFAPADQSGHEFVYPKRRATELAEASHQFVPAADVQPTTQPAELAKSPVTVMTPEKKEVEVASSAVQTAPPARTELAQALPPPSVPAPAELPRTASQLPTIALIGICALAVMLFLHFTRRVR
jgi:hypothetical protein